MSIKANYPDVRPTLNLDFANTKRLDPRISFTRASTGTYVDADGLIKTAAVNAGRFDHDPATGESKGLLIEESRTNLFTYSEDFSDSDWAKFGSATVTASSVTTPDGETNGYLLESSGTDRIEDTPSTAITGTATLSIFAKYNNVSYISMTILDSSLNGQRQWFKIDDGTLGSSTAVGTGKNLSDASIADMGNGFYRLSMSIDGFSGQTARCLIYLARTDSSFDASSGDATIIYGAQLEQGAFPTSYIPTSGSTVTRSADVATIATSDFGYREDEGTLYSEFVALGYDGIFFPVILALRSGSNSIRFIADTVNDVRMYIYNGSAVVNADLESNVYSGTSFNKLSLGYQENNTSGSSNGNAVINDTSCTIPTELSTLEIGAISGTALSSGHHKKIQYYPVRLSNTVLQGMTT